MLSSTKACSCGFEGSSHSELAEHRKICSMWQAQLGQCPECKRKHYRHVQDCSHEGEDLIRRKMLERHGFTPETFEPVLRALAKRRPPVMTSIN